MKLLIDGDILLYRCAWATEEEDEQTAKITLASSLNNIIEQFDDCEMVLCVSGNTNYRNDIAVSAEYKANRKDKPKPKHFKYLRKLLVDKYGAVVSHDEEADDVMGYMAYSDPDTVICTIDKDLDMIPGKHYNWVKDKYYEIDLEEANYNFFLQCLTGDSVDNIPGLKGIGPKKAAKLLEDWKEKDCWKLIVDAYDGDETRAIETAQLVWIRRQPDEQWTPATMVNYL